MQDLQLTQKSFWRIEYDLAAFAFQSPYNLWLFDLLKYAAKCDSMVSLESGETCIEI